MNQKNIIDRPHCIGLLWTADKAAKITFTRLDIADAGRRNPS